MQRTFTRQTIENENREYANTAGISRNNRAMGFLPGFMDTVTGRMDIARFASGAPSPVHVLDGVPAEWVVSRSSSGRVVSVRESIVSGFIQGGRFYTRQDVAAICSRCANPGG